MSISIKSDNHQLTLGFNGSQSDQAFMLIAEILLGKYKVTEVKVETTKTDPFDQLVDAYYQATLDPALDPGYRPSDAKLPDDDEYDDYSEYCNQLK